MLQIPRSTALPLVLGSISACTQFHEDLPETASAALSAPSATSMPMPSCVFGTDYVRVGNRAKVSSEIGSNGWVEVQAGTADHRTSVQGNIRSRDWVRIGPSSQVRDIVSGSWVDVQAGAEVGTVTSYASVSPEGIPTTSVFVGALDVTLQGPPSCVQRVAPGRYRNIVVNSGCRLVLAAGAYEMDSLTIQSNGALEVAGAVNVNVFSGFTFGDRATLLGANSPESLSIYSNQSVRIGADTAFTGTVTAPNGDATVATRATYSGCIRARRISLDPDVSLIGTSKSTCSPPLNSVSASHGNTDWHVDTANAFLFGVAMDGAIWAANHAPASWSRRHLHLGLADSAEFYHDNTVTASGRDTDATSGVDVDMLFFHAGHGNPDDFSALGGVATPRKMRLGNCDNGSRLRYYWQCSGKAFAHGPRTCPDGGWSYSCPELFDGSRDSDAMRNVFERWGSVVASGYLRMACGASTEALCWGAQANQIWDNYLNLGFDVADSFLFGLHESVSSPVVPLCITTGGADVTTTPLYDRIFTNQPNLGGDYFHIQFLSQFARRALRTSSPSYAATDLPVLDVVSTASAAWAGARASDDPDFYASTKAVGSGSALALIQKTTGATYLRGAPGAPAIREATYSNERYMDEARNIVESLGWTEALGESGHGARNFVASQSKRGGAVTLLQKGVVIVFPRHVEAQGLSIPVLGAGGRIVVQLNNDGSLRNASKVWRRTSPGELRPLKPLDAALLEAWAALEQPNEYQLDGWVWGYKEDAGNVAQKQLKVVLQFRFVPTPGVEDRAPRIVEVPAQ